MVTFGRCREVTVKRLSCPLSRLRRLLSEFRMLTTPRKHFDVSCPRSHCNVKQLLLISSCAVVERTVTKWDRKLKAPVVKQKSFELELKGGKIFWAERKRGEMDYPSCRWGGKSSSGLESRLAPTGLSKQLCPASTSSIETPQAPSPPPKKVEIDQMNNMNILFHHCAILSFVYPSYKCLSECSNWQWMKV